MKTLYQCYKHGDVFEKPYSYEAQFSTVKKFEILYKEELPRFENCSVHFYALPCGDEPSKAYRGLGRTGLNDYDEKKNELSDEQKAMCDSLLEDEFLVEKLMLSQESAEMFLSLFEGSENYELIWSRISGSDEIIPQGYKFLGYDVSCLPFCSGAFSIICDCMFLCKWHGCDSEGTLFIKDFQALNDCGLFTSEKDAYEYMMKYLNQEWAETGVFGIFEVYSK